MPCWWTIVGFDPRFFIAATACLLLGHLIKAARWGLFITPFKKTLRKADLFRALAIGYAVDVVLPFRLGELVRAYSLHRLAGLTFAISLATTVLDRMCDLVVVALLLGVLVAVGMLDIPLSLPLGIGAGVLLVLIMAATKQRLLKRACFFVAWPFNERVRRWMLVTCWSFLTAVGMLARRRTVLLFSVYTVTMWVAYLAAFLLINAALLPAMPGGFVQSVADHYLVGNLTRSSLSLAAERGGTLYLVFICTPLILITLYTSIQTPLHKVAPSIHHGITRIFRGMFSSFERLRLLPFLDVNDQRACLETFFASDDSRPVLTLLRENQDIAVVRNVSGGSGATTMLALRDDRLIYRKYVLGKDATRLRTQHDWIIEHAGRLPLTTILTSRDVPGYFSYDMPHAADACDLFTYIHSHDVERSWRLIRGLLDTLSTSLHQATRRPGNRTALTDYLREKYRANIATVLNAPQLAALAARETLIINEVPCRNLAWFRDRFSDDTVATWLANDHICTVHGDLTAENIIVDRASAAGYYLIDPNPVNLFDSEMIDFAKLRQSLHLGYEFLMRETSCRVNGDEVNFRHAISRNYQDLCGRLDDYLSDRFGPDGLRSVCFHELVHFARMMPYKLRQGGASAQLFYSALVLLHNRFHERYHDRTRAAA